MDEKLLFQLCYIVIHPSFKRFQILFGACVLAALYLLSVCYYSLYWTPNNNQTNLSSANKPFTVSPNFYTHRKNFRIGLVSSQFYPTMVTYSGLRVCTSSFGHWGRGKKYAPPFFGNRNVSIHVYSGNLLDICESLRQAVMLDYIT